MIHSEPLESPFGVAVRGVDLAAPVERAQAELGRPGREMSMRSRNGGLKALAAYDRLRVNVH
jgi:hypothetical protein